MIKPIDIEIEELNGIKRGREPVNVGIPFSRGQIKNLSQLKAVDESGNDLACCMTPLSRWEDGSCKWILFNCNVEAEPNSRQIVTVKASDQENKPVECKEPVLIEECEDHITIHTGLYFFEVSKTGPLAINRMGAGKVDGLSRPSRCVMTDDKGHAWETRIDHFTVERNNTLTCILYMEGDFVHEGKTHGLKFKVWIHFYSGKGAIRFDFSVWNPQAAEHPGGAWDLGDTGSLFIKDLSLEFPFEENVKKLSYCLSPGEKERTAEDNIMIYQDSSGGEHWRSKNHVNRDGDIPLTLKGYEVKQGNDVLETGDRATPVISISNEKMTLSGTLPYFWQNFPKGLAFIENKLIARIFPGQFGDVHEIQGGEQKTHVLYISLGVGDDMDTSLDWVHDPLIVKLKPDVYKEAGFSPGIVPLKESLSDELYKRYQDYISEAILGDRSFFKRREMIDEYGWRNFGELYADHEAVFYEETDGFISHYNNQYDGIKGALFQYMRTGEQAWWQLARDMAWHVADIDIYRTDKDRYQFNGGLFWHTDHHLEAKTATHRTISIKNKDLVDPRFFGGGPSYDHNYTSGFCYYYWMTGETLFKEAALQLIGYVENGINGPDTLTEYGLGLVRRIKRAVKGTVEEGPYGFNGPGRGSGNALNTMVDAYLLTMDHRYLKLADTLIRSCVGPDDDIESRDLLDSELRWMYLIFLQSLGRFIDTARNVEGTGQMFAYAKASFMHYATWVLDHEIPFLDNSDGLEFPNETWAAQDIRKADILAIAADYCHAGQRESFLSRSRYFFEVSLEHLFRFGEKTYLTRPLVLIMTNGFAHMDISMNLINDKGRSKSQDRNGKYDVKAMKGSKRTGLKSEFTKVLGILGKTSIQKEISLIKSRLKSL